MKKLVVIDMQNDFIDGSLGSEEAQKIVSRVAEKIKEFDGKIYVTMDSHDKDYLETLEGNIEHCIRGTEGWKICSEVEKALEGKNKVLLGKMTFGYPGWKYVMGDVDEIEVVGLCTDICVVSNVLILRMLFPGVKIVVDSNCCAGSSVEKHKAALEVMKSCLVEVI